MRSLQLCTFTFASLLFSSVNALLSNEELLDQLKSLKNDLHSALSDCQTHFRRMELLLNSNVAESLKERAEANQRFPGIDEVQPYSYFDTKYQIYRDAFHRMKKAVNASETLAKAWLDHRLDAKFSFQKGEMQRLHWLIRKSEEKLVPYPDKDFEAIFVKAKTVLLKNTTLIRLDQVHREEEVRIFVKFGERVKVITEEFASMERTPLLTSYLDQVGILLHRLHEFIDRGMVPLNKKKKNDLRSLD